ncbi:MAG: FAD-dependent oxidoreductase, partial [Pseudomonadota bacterium]
MDETQTLERRSASNPLSADVAVVGGGPTGMIAAIGAADAGWSTVLIAPERKPDPRTTALLMPAIHMLQGLEVWDDVEPQSAPLVTMRIVDDTGRIPRAPEIAFDAHEV